MDSAWVHLGAWLAFDGPAAFVNHLWQSTLFALAIGTLVLLLRRNSARARYALWLAASLKFLLPFAVLTVLGARLSWHPDPVPLDAGASRIIKTAGDFATPVAPVADQWQLLERKARLSPIPAPLRYTNLAPALALLWLIGGLVVVARWLLRWRALRRVLRAARPADDVDFPSPVLYTSEATEPGIVGIWKPVLLLPAGIEAHLTPEQLRTVLAHERCHLRRRDNLTAALHMLVEALFWFHPMVWWIGARLIDERERACDEQVVREGHAPQGYAEAILRVCEHYIASRLPCVSGVSGSDLRRRVESILHNPLVARLTASRKLLLTTVAVTAVATPIAAGVTSWRALEGRSLYRSAAAQYWSLLDLDQGGSTVCAPRSRLLGRRQARLAETVAGLEARDGKKVLLFAVLANSAPDVRRLLASGAKRIGDGFLLEESLMHVAAEYGQPAVLEALQEAGLSVDGMAAQLGADAQASFARSPLMVAIASGRKDNAEWFVRHGADVNAASVAGDSALSFAMAQCTDQQLVQNLIGAGAQPNEKARRIATKLGFDLLPATASSGSTDLPAGVTGQVRSTLPAAPARPYEIAGRLADAISTASSRASLAAKSLFCRGRSIEVIRLQNELAASVAGLSAQGPRVLRYAVMANSEQEVRRVLGADATHARGNEAVMQTAAQYADPPVLQALLDAGFSPEGTADAGHTPLMSAALIGRTNNVAWLIEHGANVNINVAGSTPLGVAMACRSQVLTNLLLRVGANRNAAARQSADWYGLELPTGKAALGRGTLDPPRGWQFPDVNGLLANPMRANSPSLFTEAREDFDGDGKEDHAAVFVASDGSSEALFVKLAANRRWMKAATTERASPSAVMQMGITVEKPGTHATACAKGYGRPCQPGEPANVTLENPGLVYFLFESAASLVYWDGTTKSFKQAWTSD